MKTAERGDKIQKAIAQMAIDPDIIELVRTIEAKPKTTKGHYGDYMHFLTPFTKQGRTMTGIIAEALIKAGADAYGVQYAVLIVTGGEVQ